MSKRAQGHKEVPLTQMKHSALMDPINFPDVVNGEGIHATVTDFEYTRNAIRDYHALTRLIREYGPDVTLATLQGEILALVRMQAEAI